MRHAQTSENSRHASTDRVKKSPDVMLHRTTEIANKFAGCFIGAPIRLGKLTGQYSPRGCNSLLWSLTVALDGKNTGQAILAAAQTLACDLLVKGAFTQSRLRQMIFGGATQHVMTAATLPVLLAH
jgi:Universal stress protein family